jgi:hypothetical protein
MKNQFRIVLVQIALASLLVCQLLPAGAETPSKNLITGVRTNELFKILQFDPNMVNLSESGMRYVSMGQYEGHSGVEKGMKEVSTRVFTTMAQARAAFQKLAHSPEISEGVVPIKITGAVPGDECLMAAPSVDHSSMRLVIVSCALITSLLKCAMRVLLHPCFRRFAK